MTQQETEQTLALIKQLCEDNKADDIQQYDMEGNSSVTDHYIVCSGNSDPHIRAIKEKVSFGLRQQGVTINRVDFSPQSRWVILDLGNIIFHIFHPQVRAFYAIEDFWKEGQDIDNHPWSCPDHKILRETLDDQFN